MGINGYLPILSLPAYYLIGLIMGFLTRFIHYINNHFYVDYSWFSLIAFFFALGGNLIWLGDSWYQQKLLPPTEIEIVADRITLVSNRTGGRKDSDTVFLYIDDELSPKYAAPCGGNVSLSFCGYRKKTVINNAKMKFMILLVSTRDRKNKSYSGNILSLTGNDDNVIIKYYVGSVGPTRKRMVNKGIFGLFGIICFFVAFFILLIRMVNKFQKGW